jgi:glycerophosphoryl diester phosphodiesterase
MPLVIAHRGDPIAFRENTLEAFAAAVDAGADMIELDVRLSADEHPLVVHDATLDRLWGVARRLADVTRADARALGIPDLAEALAAIPPAVQVMVDYEDEDVAEPALAVVLEAGALERSVFSGSCYDGHRRVRMLAPGARIAATWESEARIPDALLDELRVEFYNPIGNVLGSDPQAVERMHDRGTRVSVWTIDERADMELFIAMGVDAIITNRVARLVALLSSRARATHATRGPGRP